MACHLVEVHNAYHNKILHYVKLQPTVLGNADFALDVTDTARERVKEY
jgi:hypothetical protein